MIRPSMRCKLIVHVEVFWANDSHVVSTMLTFTVFSLHYLLVGRGAALVLCGIVCSCRP